MSDLSLTHDQVRKVLQALGHDKFGAEMMSMDAICYGGDCAKLGEDVRHIERILKAFPSKTIKSYNALLRKEEADELRARADKLERA